MRNFLSKVGTVAAVMLSWLGLALVVAAALLFLTIGLARVIVQ